MLCWPLISILYVLRISCVSASGVPAPDKAFVKLTSEDAERQFIRAEDDWKFYEQDLNVRLVPIYSPTILRASLCLTQLQDVYRQLSQNGADVQILASTVLLITEKNAKRMAQNREFAQCLSVKVACLDLVMESLWKVYHSEHKQAVVKRLISAIYDSKDWLSNALKELGLIQIQQQETLNGLVPQLAARLYSHLRMPEMTDLVGKIEDSLKNLEIIDPQMLNLQDLKFVGTLLIRYDNSVARMLPLAELLVKICKRFPNACTSQISNVFQNSSGYSTRHMKICRLYAAIRKTEDLHLAELDISNVEKFNWRRFRDEFFYYYNLINKADGNLKVYEAMFGKDYNSSLTICFTRCSGASPSEWAVELTTPMLVDFAGCPHDIKGPVLQRSTPMMTYLCPSGNLAACQIYCDRVTIEPAQSQTDSSEESSDRCHETPKSYLQMNPKGLEVMREHIYNLFVTAIRNGRNSIILASALCGTCQFHPNQLAYLYKEAAKVFAGRCLTQIAVVDSDLFSHIRQQK